jgi:hypothetical protein
LRQELTLVSDEQPGQKSEADAELEREIRAGRKFSVAEAIGRLAGPGMMKGVSPVAPQQQGAAWIQDFLDRNLVDSGGVLKGVLLRQVTESELFLKGFDQPPVALAGCLQRLLHYEHALKELVRESDVEWGRVFGVRPYFEKPGQPPDPDDPYTLESVRALLTALLAKLNATTM